MPHNHHHDDDHDDEFVAPQPDDHHAAYREASRAERYDMLVSAEDTDGALTASVQALVQQHGTVALDIGAGTGRVTRLLLGAGAKVTAVEPAAQMITVLKDQLGDRVEVIEADGRQLPLEDNQYNMVVAGWVYGHLRAWYQDTWQREVDTAVAEMRRCAKAGGIVVIIETLGTGTETPQVSKQHREYLDYLEKSGFSHAQTLRTDYRFANEKQARSVLGDFFGQRGDLWVNTFGHERVPECTGVWVLPG